MTRILHYTALSPWALPIALALLLGLPEGSAMAAATAPESSTGAAAGIAVGGIAQAVLGLGVVLALVAGAAWLLKRLGGVPGAGSGLIRVIGGASVGQRERIVVVEVAGTWLLVGVAPGHVRTLHTMPKSESMTTSDAPASTDLGFAARLRRIAEKRQND